MDKLTINQKIAKPTSKKSAAKRGKDDIVNAPPNKVAPRPSVSNPISKKSIIPKLLGSVLN